MGTEQTVAGHAFLSYVREDVQVVDRLQRTLEAAGVRVWRDTVDLWPGEDWRSRIRHAITDNALAFIACFSGNSVSRKKSFQNEELLLAIEQLRLRRPDEPWLIPVRFDDCALPDWDIGGGRTLASIQRADIFGDREQEGSARLVAAVLRILGQQALFPAYIRRRAEEERIRQEAAGVFEDGTSRAVLLYGPGGIGKTQLVRHLAQADSGNPMIVWLGPVDIADSEYWLLSNLERLVAQRLDPENEYFGPYLEHLSRLPGYTRLRLGHETAVSHLGRIKQIFAECYKRFIDDSSKTVVIIFDTTEAIRGTYLLVTLTQWMKSLPSTLFILSGRPTNKGTADAFKNELEGQYQGIPVTVINLAEFAWDTALEYIRSSGIASKISEEEIRKIALLTRGHPLWLGVTIDYLKDRDIPEEAEERVATLRNVIPYRKAVTESGESLLRSFKYRVMSPYSDSDFWHECMRRLAAARQVINYPTWKRLMEDFPLPEGVTELDDAWRELLQIPWVNARANRSYVMLHDALAEELGRRVISLHDQDHRWRHQIWRKAADSYRELTGQYEAEIEARQAVLEAVWQRWETPATPTEEQTARFIQDASELDTQKRELCQFEAIALYYEILCDFAGGCRQFLSLFERASREHDILLQDLLVYEMQRFLPGSAPTYALGDVIGEVINEFGLWLTSNDGRPLYLDIGLSVAGYFIHGEQPETALHLLSMLPTENISHHQLYRLSNLQGNACVRIPDRVENGHQYFLKALEEARKLEEPDQLVLLAAAYKELGFYYRNKGLWANADDAYEKARDALSQALSVDAPEEYREEMASILTNWAYIKGLVGQYRDGTNLVESAISLRRRIGRYHEEGISWNVCGEVYRYERRFERAWQAYAQAEEIFQAQRDWSWLGVVYQEQAICLFQANQDGISLLSERNPIEQAKHLITLALDLCRDLAIRGQPSALNRAGRIFGAEDFDIGLGYLTDGIDLARELSDGWFWFANLIEYIELCYRAWVQTGQISYRERIIERASEIEEVMSKYNFPDLSGRWNLTQAHLSVHDWLGHKVKSYLDAALHYYKKGFAQLAEGYVGSSGASAISGEFATFRELIWKMTPEIRSQWQDELRKAWSGRQGSLLLLAHMEELY